MKKLRGYFSQVITLLKHEERNEYLEIYEYIENCLKEKYDAEIFCPIKEESEVSESEIYWRDLGEVKKADFVITEVSVVSWGVGQELTYAIMQSKPILALYNEASHYKLSEMVSGSGLRLRKYNTEDDEWKTQITHHITEFMTELKQFLYLRDRLCARIP